MADVQAVARYLPISPRKLRLVCDQVRGMGADQALITLRHMPHKGAEFLFKLVESAVANAEQNFEMNRQDLVISHLVANEGPRLKRVKAGARGRYKPRMKRLSHVTVVLTERDEE
jgi:large subunit ribosomal protein L22